MAEPVNPVNYAVGMARVLCVSGKDNTLDSNNIEITTKYQNRMCNNIYVSSRDGTRLRTSPSINFTTSNEFLITVYYRAKRDVIKNAIETLDVATNKGDQQKKILTEFKKAYNSTAGDNLKAAVQYIVTEEQLNNAGGRLYLTDLDLLMEISDLRPMPHPYSRNGVDRKRIETLMPSCSNETLAFMFKAVDNNPYKVFADRYINIGGNIFRIPVEKDTAFSTGFHVMSRQAVDVVRQVGVQNEDLISTFYDFETADIKFGLYRSVEEAKVGGPLVEALKEQNALLTARDRLDMTREERVIQELKTKQIKEKTESEIHLNGGKMGLEYAKVGAGILTAVVTIVTLWQKLVIK